MRRLVCILLLAMFVLAVLGLIGGCAPARQALRPDGQQLPGRIPPAETVDIRLLQARPPRPPQSPPFSVPDESEGRWLTLFEVIVTPSEAAGVPSAPAGSR